MLGERGRKFLGLFLVFLLVALLFQLYLERHSRGASFPAALGYSVPVALLAALLLMFLGKQGDGE